MKRQKLIELRTERNLTQQQVAEQAGLARSYYGFIENGLRNPTLGKALRIAEVFGLSLEEVFPNDVFFNEKSYAVKQLESLSPDDGSDDETSATLETA